ncbi:redox-regulated ATPase YchF [Candidatus Woesearchaeota archaeon]|nr:redox-regulated ATPase YchF [Candidatus Woesearchaeota archaeon]
MIIGLVGKPSSGKSTFFKASTLAEVEIAPYPFTTIEKNEGVGFVKIDCVEKEFNVKCNPRFGYCLNSKRFVPVKLIDVAGLVPGAHEGKGLGSKFLNDLNEADALIHVIDISGSTNERGEQVPALSYYPGNDIKFLENELDQWYLSIIKKVWEKDAKKIQQAKVKVSEALFKQLSGLKVTEEMTENAVKELPAEIIKWNEDDLLKLSSILRIKSKPMIIAANKIDVPGSSGNLEKIKKEFPDYLIIPCSAESELALKEAAKKNLIEYIPGENNFKITGNLDERQKKALDFIKENVLDKFNSAGIQDCLNNAVFNILKYIAIFPGGLSKLSDSEGRVLPDVFLLPNDSTALDFAYKIHSDIGDKFVKAIDVKKRLAIGKDHKLKNRDVIEIKTS